jgi:tRNA threonylcarbamoyladenosine biosynthesis protein TsaE
MHRYTEEETERMAANLLAELQASAAGATVLGLTGELGAGKTTLAKAIAKLLAVPEDVQSPTFVVMKGYEPKEGPFQKLIHMDAYRIESLDELAPLKFNSLLAEPNTLIIIEWPERIKDALPDTVRFVVLEHDGDRRILRYA